VDPTVFRSAAISQPESDSCRARIRPWESRTSGRSQNRAIVTCGGLAGAGVTGIEQSMTDVVVAGAIGEEAVIRMRWKLSDSACDRTRRRNSSASGPRLSANSTRDFGIRGHEDFDSARPCYVPVAWTTVGRRSRQRKRAPLLQKNETPTGDHPTPSPRQKANTFPTRV
jgi:hypothetical protein